MRLHLAPGLPFEQRRALLLDAIERLGWRVAPWPRWLLALGWSKRRSASLPLGLPKLLPGRTLYLADSLLPGPLGTPSVLATAVLAHELEHALRQERAGRLPWLLAYTGGPILAVLGLLTLPLAVLCSPWWLLTLALAALAWLPSERFRLTEEIEGEAQEAALIHRATGRPLSECVSCDLLGGYQWPYLVGGKVSEARRRVEDRAQEALEA